VSHIEIFRFVGFIIGVTVFIIGIAAIFRPQQMSVKFGIPLSGQGLPFVISTGIRDVLIGLVVLALFYNQLWNLLGLTSCFLGMVAISDFLVVRKYGDKKTSIIHAAGAIGVIAYGVWLLSV
jgi:hypothetical protein